MGRRIKDFEYTASAFSPDDYIAIDGETQGTRNMQYSTLVAEMSAAIGGGGGGGSSEEIKSVYIDPKNGSDTNSGTDRHNPVETSQRAYAVMEELGLDTVVILDKITLAEIGEVEGIYFDQIPQSLVLETFNIVNEVDGSICIVLDTLPANSKIASYNDAVITLLYKDGLRANLEIESKSSVELHHYLPGNDYGYPIANLKVNTAGDFYLNCVQYQESEYGYYPDDYLYNSYITSSINVKSKNAYLVGLYEYGAEIYVETTENITNSLDGSSEEPFDDNTWTTIENTMKFIAPNGTIYALQGGYAKDYIVDCLNFDGHSQVVVKNLTQIHATGYCNLMDILSGDVEAKGRVIVTGGDESQNTVLNTLDAIMPHNTSEGNCYDYAPEVFIDWKGLIHHTSNSFYVNKYFERSNGYTEDSERLYIEAMEVDHYDENDQIVYNTNPIEIISSGTVQNLDITTGIDVASGKFVPVHIKCKNLVSNGICIYSHDIVIEAENDIQYSEQNVGNTAYFQILPSKYYQDFRPSGFVDKTVAANVRLIATRNIEFLPSTSTSDEVNQTLKIDAGNELILKHYTGNNGITQKVLYVKARRMSGVFRNINAEIHIDVDEFFSTPYNIFEIDGGGAEPTAASLLTTQSTFHAKTIVMQARDYTVSPVEQNKGIFGFWMSDSYPTVVRNLDIQVGVIACDFNWGGGIYCPLLYSCSTYNGEISGEIGTIINTYNGKIHKVTRWQHDLIFYQPDDITYWKTGARVSLHFADRSSPSDIFVDPDQGDDRFDGLTASRPVKTVVGLYRALKAQGYTYLDHSNHYVQIDKPITLHMLSGFSGSNRGVSSIPSSSGNYSLQLYVNRGMTGDTDLQGSYTYEFLFESDLEIVPEAPNLRVAFQYLNSADKIIEARGFESFYVDGYAGSVLIVEAANVIRINNDISGPVTTYSTRWNGGYNTFKSREIELRGRFYNVVADADYQFSIYDTASSYAYSSDNCCLCGYAKIHAAYSVALGTSETPVGAYYGLYDITSDFYISAYLDTLLGEMNMTSGAAISGSIGSSFMQSKLRMKSKTIKFYSGSFNGTGNMGNQSDYPGSYIDIEAEQSISSSGTSSIAFYRCDVNIKTKYFNSPQIYLYGDQNSKSVIEAEVITPMIAYRFGNVTVKATHASNIISRSPGGPISVSGSYAENLYIDINEFDGYIYLPYESGQYNYISRVFARIGTAYQPIVNWGFDPVNSQTPVVAYSLSVTVEHSKYNPSGNSNKKSNYGDALPANAYGEILILNDMDVEIPQPQVVNKTAVIPSGSTIAGVELENDNYNVIATIPASATELDVNFPESTDKVQESGFQFDVEANSQLALVKAFVAGRQIPVKAPSVFDSTKMYQGTSLHNAVVIAEFDVYPITITNIEATNDTSSSIDIDVTGTMGSDPLPNNIEYTLSLSLDGVITDINAIGPTTTLTGTNFTNYSNATDVAAIVTIGGNSYTAFTLKGNPLILDGRLYKTVTIGNQTWMAENLDYKFNGLQLNNSSWSYDTKQADYYDKDEATYGVNGNKYGLLYNFIATKYLNDNKSTLIPGWHVPTLEEWNTLIEYAGGNNVAGSKLKSTTDWMSGPPGADGTDEYGFNAKPAGYGSDDDNVVTFTGVGTVTYFLTSTPIGEGNFNPCNLIGLYNSSAAASLNTGFGNDRPFSIRLIKNDPYNPLDLPSNTIRVKYRSGTQPTLTNSNATVTQVDSSTNTYDVTLNDTYWSALFMNQTNLVEVLGANTSSVTSMAALFNGCSNLTTVAAFNTSKVTDMNYMFYKCNYLTSIQKIDTSRVTNMSYMFAKCTSLTTVPEFNTSSVTNMEQMFAECSAITTVPTFNTQNVTNMNSMFAVCSSLTSVPLFDTSNVTNMQSMFNSCTRVESGALALYQRASTQTNVPSSHSDAFYNCGSNTTAGSKELSQIATDWGGALIIDGKRYGITKIGNQEWMTDNLDYQIPNAQYNTGEARITTPAMWYFNLDASTYGRSGKNYGLLYNWFAAKYLNDNKETLIPGWRVPTKADFETLKATLNSNLDGKMLKSTTDWSNNGNGTDDYQFRAYPAGYRSESGMLFSWLGTSGRFWTTTVNSNDIPYLANLSSSSNALTISEMGQSSTAEGCKCIAISLRLIRDV